MSSLLVIGGGGHGRVVADAAIATGAWENLAFLDDQPTEATRALGLEILRGFQDLERVGRRFTGVALGVGDNAIRFKLLERCLEAGLRVVSIIHPSAVVSSATTIGTGSVVFAQAAINIGSVLGKACIVNTAATIDHDCLLGDAVHVSPGAHLAGAVKIGSRSWIGIGACVRQCIEIGSDAIVGAGGVVVADVADGATVFGVPAKVRI